MTIGGHSHDTFGDVLAVVPYNLGDGPSGPIRKARRAFGGNRRARQVQRSFQRPEQDEGFT